MYVGGRFTLGKARSVVQKLGWMRGWDGWRVGGWVGGGIAGSSGNLGPSFTTGTLSAYLVTLEMIPGVCDSWWSPRQLAGMLRRACGRVLSMERMPFSDRLDRVAWIVRSNQAVGPVYLQRTWH